MINSINTNASMPPPPRNTDQNLTDEQQLFITDTLSEYDAKNVTETDALNIVASFSQAGIKPGSALEQTLSDLGFDAKNIGELSNISTTGHRPPPPPEQSTEEISSMVEFLTELLEEKLAANIDDSLSDEDKQSILTQVFNKFDLQDADSIINTTV
jgi:hypothetical protein